MSLKEIIREKWTDIQLRTPSAGGCFAKINEKILKMIS
jgi:hypothetical protein